MQITIWAKWRNQTKVILGLKLYNIAAQESAVTYYQQSIEDFIPVWSLPELSQGKADQNFKSVTIEASNYLNSIRITYGLSHVTNKWTSQFSDKYP